MLGKGKNICYRIGAFGECFAGLRKFDKKRFAIKIISKKQMKNPKIE
jgi:hypothetical protein